MDANQALSKASVKTRLGIGNRNSPVKRKNRIRIDPLATEIEENRRRVNPPLRRPRPLINITNTSPQAS